MKDEEVNPRTIEQSTKWRAFIPKDPEIFGHTILTPKDHIPSILEVHSKDKEVFQELSDALLVCSQKLANVDNVEKIYVVMAGEDPTVHIHYHLFPRFDFLNEDELNLWARNNRISTGELSWRKFYARPTAGYKYFEGFQYVGEIERAYHEYRETRAGNKGPSPTLQKAMAEMIVDAQKR